MNIATRIREEVHTAPPGTFWRTDHIEGPRPAVHTALHRLAKDGELVRLRRGLYWKGTRSRYGKGHPSRLESALAAAGPGAGPTGWAAANLLALSTQVPAVPEVAVLGNPPTGIPGVRFRTRSNLERRLLDPHGIALLEVLRNWPDHTGGDWNKLTQVVGSLSRSGNLDPVVFEAVARNEPSTSVRSLIGRALHECAAHPQSR